MSEYMIATTKNGAPTHVLRTHLPPPRPVYTRPPTPNMTRNERTNSHQMNHQRTHDEEHHRRGQI
uniref:Uncharacterized protein n=1 Tax=Arundo donax TaxID=35708 RepID=A0A0A9FTE6_ARUDO